MRSFFTNLFIVIFLVTGVAAHASSYLTSQQSDEATHELVYAASADNSQKFITPSNNACKNQQHTMFECVSMHCAFHYVILNPFASGYLHATRQSHARMADNTLAALFLKSAKKPPRLFS